MDSDEDRCSKHSDEDRCSTDSDEDRCSTDSDEDFNEVRCSTSPEQLEDKQRYRVVNDERIEQLMHSDISQVSSVLRVSRGLACTLLRRNKWSLNRLYEEWFADSERVLDALGVLSEQKIPKELDIETLCQNMKIDDGDHDGIDTLKYATALCGVHRFSPDFWKKYIAASIDVGPRLPCPGTACKGETGLDIVDAFASDEDKDKYYRCLVQCYVDRNFNLRRCPRPGCCLVIHQETIQNYDLYVTCDCYYRFCWLCSKENHRPVDCETANKWLSEPPLRDDTDGYARYYERWDSSNKSEGIAVDNLNRAKDELIETLASVQRVGKYNLKFVIGRALEKITECRGVLRWSYANGYYLSLAKSEKKALFEHMQEEAEAALERLHHCANEDIKKYVDADRPSPDFNDFRAKLVHLTCITEMYFDNFVRAVEIDFRVI